MRDRIGDIPLLITNFVKQLSDRFGKKIDYIVPDVFRICSQYEWPGNIRELQNVIDRAANLADGNIMSPDLLPETLYRSTDYSPLNLGEHRLKIIKSASENSTILEYLERNKGNMTLAAKELGIARSTLYRKVRNITGNSVN
ncbi:AAA-type ATPase lid domain-containing protein [Desulfosporosinus fructosivorans]